MGTGAKVVITLLVVATLSGVGYYFYKKHMATVTPTK